MKVLELKTGKPVHDQKDLLDACDALRRAIEAGELVAFIAAGITATDEVRGWTGAQAGVTRLRMMGAIANLEHCYHHGDLDEGDA